MPNNNRKAIKLRKANRYNTYQFYGEMANKNINPKDGLKIAILSCFSWLRNRLDNKDIPKELLMPEAKDYRKVNNGSFESFTINDSFIISVITDFDEGIWSLRIIENDSGALNDNAIVPGRTIESDIAFRIVDNKLECGFKTIVNDLNDITKADCIRFSLVKELGFNQNFGLKQVNNLYYPNDMIIDDTKLEEIYNILHSKDNQLPLIIFSYDDHLLINIDEIEFDEYKFTKESLLRDSRLLIEKAIKDNKKEDNDITVKAGAYLAMYFGYARPYFLPKKCFEKYKSLFNIKVKLDEVYIIEPGNYKVSTYSYSDREKAKQDVRNYTRDIELNFNNVLFLDDAGILIQAINEQKNIQKDKLLDNTIEKLNTLESKQARETRIQEHVSNDSSKDELVNALERINQNEKEKNVLNNEISRLKAELKKKNDYIEYIKRKENRPKQHKDIADWVSQFNNIILDKKAIACLNNNDATNVSVDVICDALDYLDKAYSEYLFNNLSIDELNELSSNIYNRPYNVTPSGIPVSCKGDCKIKYAFVNEKRIEHVLDQHLKIGSHGELLRIYFIVDKDREKIVIGSLPNHLEY